MRQKDGKTNKKIVLIVVGVVIFLVIGIFVFSIVKDKIETNKKIENIKVTHEDLKNKVKSYNMLRVNLYRSFEEIYHNDIHFIHSENTSLLYDYEDKVIFMLDVGKELDKNCVTIYNNKEVDNICNTYRKDLEIIANVFISDVNEYNAEIDKYNKENNDNLELFKFKNINEYIDYNGDGIFSKEEEKNEEK